MDWPSSSIDWVVFLYGKWRRFVGVGVCIRVCGDRSNIEDVLQKLRLGFALREDNFLQRRELKNASIQRFDGYKSWSQNVLFVNKPYTKYVYSAFIKYRKYTILLSFNWRQQAGDGGDEELCGWSMCVNGEPKAVWSTCWSWGQATNAVLAGRTEIREKLRVDWVKCLPTKILMGSCHFIRNACCMLRDYGLYYLLFFLNPQRLEINSWNAIPLIVVHWILHNLYL